MNHDKENLVNIYQVLTNTLYGSLELGLLFIVYKKKQILCPGICESMLVDKSIIP